MKRPLLAIPLLALLGCQAAEPAQGTAVGNPIGLQPKVAQGENLRNSAAAAPLDRLVTHRFALERYEALITANVERGRSGALKTIFTLDET